MNICLKKEKMFILRVSWLIHLWRCSATAADDRLRSPVLSGLSFAVIDVGDPSTRALFVIDSGSDLPSPVAADSILGTSRRRPTGDLILPHPSPPVHPHPHFLFADSIPAIWFKVIYAAGIRWHSILRWPSFSLLALISSPTVLSRFHVERSSYRMFALQWASIVGRLFCE